MKVFYDKYDDDIYKECNYDLTDHLFHCPLDEGQRISNLAIAEFNNTPSASSHLSILILPHSRISSGSYYFLDTHFG